MYACVYVRRKKWKAGGRVTVGYVSVVWELHWDCTATTNWARPVVIGGAGVREGDEKKLQGEGERKESSSV